MTDLGIDRSTVAKTVQLMNAKLPMLVTLLPMVALVKLLQLLNAVFPILVTLLGIVMLVRLMQ
tara:strand:+ start:170 stop:358 length:189 start_codon:yes stop_codon:yes gene_type:complete